MSTLALCGSIGAGGTAGVRACVMAACKDDSLPRTVELASRFPGWILPTYGLHPWFIGPEVLERSYRMKACTCLPKENLGGMIPFLEDILTHDVSPEGKTPLGKLGNYINRKFGKDWTRTCMPY